MPITTGTQILDLFFPGIGAHLQLTNSPYQFSHTLSFCSSSDIETIHRQLIGICMWARDNFTDGSWYINKTEFKNDFDHAISFCFDFANAEDMMAFKLRWT